jgi:hypothetical protein
VSSTFRGTNGKSTFDNLDDTAYESVAEHPPILKGIIGVCEIAVGISGNIVQITTSTYGFFSIALGDHYKYANVVDLYKASPFIFLMALFIALGIQGFLHKNGQSMSSTWARLRQIQQFGIKSMHAKSDSEQVITFGTVYFVLALVGDIAGDATFAALYTANRFFIGGWIIMLTGSSTLLMYDGFTRLWGALEDAKDYWAYHEKHGTKPAGASPKP